MNQTPLVSIIVPSLNRAQFLIPTLESILRQDYSHIECLVIDGGSKDDTLNILKNYEGRITWVSESDQNHADAINKGFKLAKGEILTWLNIDDCYAVSDAVSKAMEHFQNHSEVDVVYGDYKMLSENGEVISNLLKPRNWNLEYAIKNCFYTITQPASFIRRSILEQVGFLDPDMCHNIDHELWLRIGLKGTIQYIPGFLAYTRSCKGVCQTKEAATAKVKTIQKILKHPDLPLSFKTANFKRQAMSSAYLTGAITALVGHHSEIFFSYLIQAIKTNPFNILHILMKSLKALATVFLPNKLKMALKKILFTSSIAP